MNTNLFVQGLEKDSGKTLRQLLTNPETKQVLTNPEALGHLIQHTSDLRNAGTTGQVRNLGTGLCDLASQLQEAQPYLASHMENYGTHIQHPSQGTQSFYDYWANEVSSPQMSYQG